jgi:DNA-directed RNA polymerase subunit M/transcription elongation factor TFIIS
MKCTICQRDYPSKYHFVNESVCLSCFEELPENEKREIVSEVQSMTVESAAQRTVHGKVLECPVCGHDKFWKRQTLMNTPGMTFWGFDWANKQADNLICDKCGYIYWFFRE